MERIQELKDRFLSIVEEQLNGDLSLVDAHELGEIVDCAKDCAEIIMLCAKAKYYMAQVDEKSTTDTQYSRMYYSNRPLVEEVSDVREQSPTE